MHTHSSVFIQTSLVCLIDIGKGSGIAQYCISSTSTVFQGLILLYKLYEYSCCVDVLSVVLLAGVLSVPLSTYYTFS